jgi:hypothetical protein
LANQYDVTIITLRPGTQPRALAALKDRLTTASDSWPNGISDIGALNQILLLRPSPAADATIEARMAALASRDAFGIGKMIHAITMDTYVAFDFMPPVKPENFGPRYEVRTYVLKTDGLAPTTELWRKAVPGRVTVSPLLTAMTSVTGTVTRFMHIWP